LATSSKSFEHHDYKITTVILNTRELAFARHIADRRNDKAEGVKSARIASDRTDYSIHQQGAEAEIAVFKQLNWPVDISVNKHGGDDGIDGYCGNHSVQVKSSRHCPPSMIFNYAGDFRADVAIACLVRPKGHIDIYGYITRQRFMGMFVVRDYGYGTRLVVEPKHLKPFSDLNTGVDKMATITFRSETP